MERRWVQAVTALLGLWLATSPWTFGYRSTPLAISDLASGAAAVCLGFLGLRPGRPWAARATAAVGLWLLLAPLVFRAPDAVGYATDGLAGALLVGFGLLAPLPLPLAAAAPRGWSYDPSSWSGRAPSVALALLAFFVARAMAGYQLGYVGSMWSPATEAVLRSKLSQAVPVPDAGLGAVVYLLEACAGLVGDERRWQTAPRLVLVYGAVVVPFGLASVVLAILQPVVVGAWCVPCLVAAAAALVMIPLALDEVAAAVQHLLDPRADAAPAAPEALAPRAFVRGLSAPWTLWLSAAIGVWLAVAPGVLPEIGAAADASRIGGVLAVAVAVIAMAEVARPLRLANVLVGLGLVVAPWLEGGAGFEARGLTACAGVALVALALPLGPVREQYGVFDRAIAWPRRGRGLRSLTTRSA